MTKASSGEMERVHSSLARLIQEELDFIDEHNRRCAEYEGDPANAPMRIRLESALVNSIARFLNDNDITADPANNEDLNDLRADLVKRSAAARGLIAKARSLEDEIH